MASLTMMPPRLCPMNVILDRVQCTEVLALKFELETLRMINSWTSWARREPSSVMLASVSLSLAYETRNRAFGNRI